MQRLYWMIAPWPNAVAAVVVLACISYSIWPQQHFRIPLIVGALIGLLPAILDATARPAVRPALRAAKSLAEVTLAYRSKPFARIRHALTIALAIAAGLALNMLLPDAEVSVGLVGGLAVTHFITHAILGFWTAWPTTAEANAL